MVHLKSRLQIPDAGEFVSDLPADDMGVNRGVYLQRPRTEPRTPARVLSMTGGIAGRLSRVRIPEPWTGAEKVEGMVGLAFATTVGTAVMEAVDAMTEEGLAPPKFTARRALEEATLMPRPPSLSPRRGEAVAPATRRARVVVSCIVKFEAVERLIAQSHREV